MKKSTLIPAILSCALLAYVAAVLPVVNHAERNDTFKGLRINVEESSHSEFLRPEDINAALGDLSTKMDTLKRKNLNTYKLEQQLNRMSRVEKCTCRILSDGTLEINVTPFDPVARVFDPKGSVYINAVGKRVPTRLEYHVDVPVITSVTVVDSGMINRLLPVLRALKVDDSANALVSSVHFDRRGDIILIPNIVGHVINFGDSTLIDNKFKRLQVFYRDVMPVRGWNAFDTVSVKWAGQVVATKRDKTDSNHMKFEESEIFNDIPDANTMDDSQTASPSSNKEETSSTTN